MAEMPVMHIKLDGDGLGVLARLIAQLQYRHDELECSLTHVQAVSTQQVERIRALEAALVRLEVEA